MSNDVVGVRFQHGATKIYSYRLGYLISQIRLGDQVVVETRDGQDIGKVVMLGPLRGKRRDGTLKNVVRRATPRDLVMRHWYRRREGDALLATRRLITDQRLPVKAIKAEFAYDGSRMTLHLQPHDEKTEDLNVSELCEEIGRQYKTRVGVRRIGPRDAS